MLSRTILASTNLARISGSSAGISLRRFFAAESHDDFKPIRKQMDVDLTETLAKIKKQVESDKLVLYMKGIPEAPQCGFSQAVVKILEVQGVKGYTSFNVLEDPALREGIKQFSNWKTIPQVYINGEFIGGCDIMLNLHQSGELRTMLQDATLLPKDSKASDASE